jgi:hypothetical protein
VAAVDVSGPDPDDTDREASPPRKQSENDLSNTPRQALVGAPCACLRAIHHDHDTSIIGVALPDIQAALGFSPEGLSWVFNAYVIAFGGLLLSAAGSATCSARAMCSRPDSSC